MRPLKFRVWDTQTKKFLEPDSNCVVTFICPPPNGEYSRSIDEMFLEEPGRFEVDQFTGLKDSAGREIYEWDILRAEWDAPVGHMVETFVIRFGLYEDGEGFPNVGFYKRCSLIQKEEESGGNIYPGMRGQIIGNIHENTEILKNS